MKSKTENQIIAETILEQLGGNRFTAMTGANSFVWGDRKLTFRIPQRMTINKAKGVVITLEDSDTYTVEFFGQKRAPSFDVFTISKHGDVYAEDLARTFTDQTGLDTRL